MIDSMLSVVDRLSEMLRSNRRADAAVFAEQIEPIYADLTTIHDEYVAFMEQIEQLASVTDAAPQTLRFEICVNRELLPPLKEKVRELGRRVETTAADGTVRNLAAASYNLFRLATKEGTTAAYSTLLDLVKAFVWGDFAGASCLFTPGRQVHEVEKNVDLAWREITKVYDAAKQKLVPQ